MGTPRLSPSSRQPLKMPPSPTQKVQHPPPNSSPYGSSPSRFPAWAPLEDLAANIATLDSKCVHSICSNETTVYVAESTSYSASTTSSRPPVSICVRDPTTGRLRRQFAQCRGAVSCLLAPSGHGELGLWVGMCDGLLTVYQRKGKEKYEMRAHSTRILSLCEGEQLIWSAAADGVLKAWCTSSATLRRTCRGHSGPVNCLSALSAAPHVTFRGSVWSGSDDHTLRVWPAEVDGNAEAIRVVHQSSPVLALCALAVPRPRVWAADVAGYLGVWHGGSHEALRSVICPSSCEPRVLCMAGTMAGVWCGDEDGRLSLYDSLSTALLARHLPASKHPMRYLTSSTACHATRQEVVWAVHDNNTVRVWRSLERIDEQSRRLCERAERQHNIIRVLPQQVTEALKITTGNLAAASKRSEQLTHQALDIQIRTLVARDPESSTSHSERAAQDETLTLVSTEQRAIAAAVEETLLSLRNQVDTWLEEVRASTVAPRLLHGVPVS